MSLALASKFVEVADLEAAVELCYERNWTDGLPVVPPTAPAIGRILSYLQLDPQAVIGVVPPRNGIATVEKVAINCVMAGCKPEHVPIVIAALEAVLDPAFNLAGVQTTTNPCAPLVVVSGPAVRRLGFNTKDCAIGHGSRSNGAVGRALRLILWNIGGGFPGEPCRTTHGHPGYWSYCVAEDDETCPWEPLQVSQGFDRSETSVTVVAVDGPHATNTGALLNSPEQVMGLIANAAAGLGSNNMLGGAMALVLSPMSAKRLAEGGYTRRSLAEAVVARATRRAGTLRQHRFIDHMLPAVRARLDALGDDERFAYFDDPQKIVILVTGSWGAVGGYAAICPGWGHFGGYPQIRRVRFPQQEIE
jgi:hypothetical protein